MEAYYQIACFGVIMSIQSIIPDPEALLALEPEELAGTILEYFNSTLVRFSDLNRYNFTLPHTVRGYPKEYRERILMALMEGWVWLERESLLAPRPGSQGEWAFITRRGNQI